MLIAWLGPNFGTLPFQIYEAISSLNWVPPMIVTIINVIASAGIFLALKDLKR